MTDSAVTSSDRLTFTLFVAVMLHALVVLGVTFTQPTPNAEAPHTLDVTLASYQSEQAPEKADFLAQANQQGSGELDEAKMLTTDTQALFKNNTPQDTSPYEQHLSAPQPKPEMQQVVTTTASSSHSLNTQIDQDETQEEPVDDGPPQALLLKSLEIASLEAKLEQLRQQDAKRPRVQRLTAASTMSANDALYLNTWRQRIEDNGARNYPREAENCFNNCRLRLLVAINANGTIKELIVMESSGRKVLDDAALRIVRMSAPFAPFNEEMKKNADVLEIIRTWQFKGNKYLSEAG